MTEHKPLTAEEEALFRDCYAHINPNQPITGTATSIGSIIATLDAERTSREAAEGSHRNEIGCRLAAEVIGEEYKARAVAAEADRDRLAAECESLRAALRTVHIELAALVADPENPDWTLFHPEIREPDAKCLTDAYKAARLAGKESPDAR